MIKDKPYAYFLTGILISLLGAICFSTKAVMVKLAYRETDIDAVTLLALRMLFSLPFFLLSATAASRKHSNVRFTGRQWIAIALIGMLGYYVSSYLDFVGLQYITAGMERLILFIYPTIVLLISVVVFREKIRQRQMIALIITYAGLLLAFWGEVDFNQAATADFYFGALCIFLCAITFATYIAGSGRLIPLVGASKFNSYAMSFACAAVLVHFFVVSDRSLLHLSTEVYVYSLLMAVVATVIPSYLVAEGIKRIGSENAAIVGSVGPISTIIQAYFFLQEPIFALQLAGTALILVGVLMIGKKKQDQPVASVVKPSA
ncbi:MAG TPA: DMT family transporter [Ohtaekwangia sp.]|nr:DMT family transporter [Ohtaekwangia sp.]